MFEFHRKPVSVFLPRSVDINISVPAIPKKPQNISHLNRLHATRSESKFYLNWNLDTRLSESCNVDAYEKSSACIPVPSPTIPASHPVTTPTTAELMQMIQGCCRLLRETNVNLTTFMDLVKELLKENEKKHTLLRSTTRKRKR